MVRYEMGYSAFDIDKQNICSYNIIIATVGIVDTKREEIKQTLSLEFNLA